jgi:phosphatidate phosphatase APP1
MRCFMTDDGCRGVLSFMRIAPVVVLAVLSLPPAVAHAVGTVVLFPALGRPTLVTVGGRVLESSPEHDAAPLTKNVRRLTTRGVEGAEVKVSFAGQTRVATSGEDGQFEVSFPAAAPSPFPAGLQPVRAVAADATGEGKVEIVSDATAFLVVSDFDDTIAVSNVQSKRGLIKAALLSDEESQPVVEGMAAFYGCLREGAEPAPGFAIVSGSPVEFGPRLEAFLAKGDFPFAALHLRKLSSKTLSRFKQPVLRALLSRFPQRFVFVGDSGEQDPETYAQIRQEFPGRVAAVFIRDVGKSADPVRFKDMVLFKTAADAAKDAAAKGLLKPECLARAFPAQSK